ncbi:MAG TPA: penicillin-binding protein 1B [Acidiferrobacterales bacterium]
MPRIPWKSALTRLADEVTWRRTRIAGLTLLLTLAAFALYLDIAVRAQFEGKRWALPARVYARPLELFPGGRLSPEQLVSEISLLRYRTVASGDAWTEPGGFQRRRDEIELVTRPFQFGDGTQPALHLILTFDDGRIERIRRADDGSEVTLARLDPLHIGNIYPAHNEDRLLVRLGDVPPALVESLIAIEDRKFYQHHGVDPRGMGRALVTTVSGGGVQGGSTLTQQLIKNFYLSSERTLRRKFTEILMALLLELHYSKDEILEAYLNEVYLGQDGERAVHGFGLAAQFYFAKPLEHLSLPEAALLVGMLKGPGTYDPRRHPQRALARRNLVLSELRRQEKLDDRQYLAAKTAPLGVARQAPGSLTAYPAFIDLVHRQLRRDYDDADLRSEGLRILTTLDPLAQRAAERALAARLPALEKARRLPADSLQGAAVVGDPQNGEVHAVVGGRDPRFAGFNRALDARRQIGSLIKPVIYLTALEQPERYTLATRLDDGPLTWQERGIPDWQPQNYDKEFHGEVPLPLALAQSYNVSSARLGLELGVPQVMARARSLGVEQPLPAYASGLLGSAALTPFEVTQMYQTLASGGFRVPLRAIRAVLTPDGHPLQRYPLAVEQAIAPAPAYLITHALQGVVRAGTAKGIERYLAPEIAAAGKTGTTDQLRDSWFAGYTGDRVAVVWVGRDDDASTGLTGASGAMTVWGMMLRDLNPEPLVPPQPDDIEPVLIDPATGLRADAGCADAVELPFIRGSEPAESSPCAGQAPAGKVRNWFQRLFDRD